MRLTVRAHLHRCPRCGAAVIRALTPPPAALEARADPLPLGIPGELRALFASRFTYDLVTLAGHQELWYRDQWRIKNRNWPVLADHHCPGPIPWTAIPATAPPAQLPGIPPF